VIKYKICAEGGCDVRVAKPIRRCEAHTRGTGKSGWAERPSGRASKGRLVGSKWRKLRAHVIARDFGLCQVCKAKGLIRNGTECDHIDNDGTDDMSNLQMICDACHKVKTQDESRAAREV
jgi:5-methylcytosine-specific restriction protein A